MKSLRGHFLLASPQLLDPNFARAVVLLVKHDEEGAIGLIVNRPMETKVAEVCEKALEMTCDRDDVIYHGGPCEGPVMIIHVSADSTSDPDGAEIEFTARRDEIETLLRENDAKVKCFVGYAGWSAGQLESELETGSWLTTEADPRLIFDRDPDLWTRLKTRFSLRQWIDPARIPDDPSVN